MTESLVLHQVEQGSDAWRQLRVKHRPSSMASWLTRASRMHGPLDAYRFFTGVEPKISEYQQKLFDHGHAMEPRARDFLEISKGFELEPAVGTRGFYLASLDCWNRELGYGGEVKCPYSRKSKTWEYAEQGGIDPQYATQLESQWRVFDLERADLLVYYSDTKNIVLPYRRDDNLWGEIQRAWDAFCEKYVKTGKVPGPEIVTDDKVVALLASYAVIDANIKQLQENLKPIRADIEAALGQECWTSETVEYHYGERDGSIDWQAIVKEHLPGIDPELYRGDPSFVTTLRPKKPASSVPVAEATPKQPRARQRKEKA